MSMCIYILFFTLFSIMVYYRILNLVSFYISESILDLYKLTHLSLSQLNRILHKLILAVLVEGIKKSQIYNIHA